MDREGFKNYLRKGGRSPNAINRCLKYVSEYEIFLLNNRGGKKLTDAGEWDLIQFVDMLDKESGTKAKGYLWGLAYYYDFISNEELRELARLLRADRIERKPFPIKEFRGVDQDFVRKLNQVGIKNINQMIEAGKTPQDRKELSEKTGIPENSILEFVKLSDLARIPGIKGIRARLYYEVGIDTSEKLGSCDPINLRETVEDFVEGTGFDGIPTLPAEARFSIEKAKKMPKIVEYD